MVRKLVAVLLCSQFAASAEAALPDGIAGPWYNPAQSGHGLSITLTDRGTRGVVLWHVYDPDGAALTLYIDAVVNGRTLEGTAYAPSGMRFGEFNPDEVDLPVWGQVRLSFDDCERANVSWEAGDARYGTGSLPIERLARIDSLECVLPPPNGIPGGLHVVSHAGGSLGGYNSALGIVDREGRLWAVSGTRHDGNFYPADIPAPSFVSSRQPMLFLSTPLRVLDDNTVDVQLTLSVPNWAWSRGSRSVVNGRWEQGEGAIGRFPGADDAAGVAQTWESAPESLARLVAPIDAGILAGDYRFPLRGQFFEFSNTLRIDAEGNAELADFVGHVSASEGEDGLIDFQLRSRNNPWIKPYVGRGWIHDSALGRRLVLIGENGSNGLALVATREGGAR